MKKQLVLLSIMMAVLGMTSCRFALTKIYGIKDPDIESPKSIKKFALKKGMDTANILTVNAGDYYKTLKFVHGIPNAAIFDSRGDFIEYKAADTSCNAGLFGFIPNLKTTNTYNKTGVTTLSSELAGYRTLKGLPIDKSFLAPADFYVLLYWTVWTGKLNKDHVKIWEDLAKSNTNARIQIIKVNLDFQEHWDKTKRDSIINNWPKK